MAALSLLVVPWAGCSNPESSSLAELGDGGGFTAHAVSTSPRAREFATALVWNPAPDIGTELDRPLGGPPGWTPALAETMPASRSGAGVDASATTRTLVIYDATGPNAWLGELYAIGVVNLVSHFGSWTAVPSAAYSCGDIDSFTAVIYLGSTYDEPLPPCLLDDVLRTTRPVTWICLNFWQLVARAGGEAAFSARYGFTSAPVDVSRFVSVRYHGRSLVRYADDLGILGIRITDATRALELATAVRADGTTAPWAVRSGSLTLIAELPFSHMSEENRVLAFDDLLFDALAPSTPERHRALVRLEDVDPTASPAALRAIADYLYSVNVPFGIGVVSEYRDPTGYYNAGVPRVVGLRDSPAMVDALRYMQARGGVLVMHGRTHQWDGGPNPYSGVTGDDTEFFRVTMDSAHSFAFTGPVPEDSFGWASGRIRTAERAFRNAGLSVPVIFEFPHYTASAIDYVAAGDRMPARWERSLYFRGLLSGGTIDYSRVFGQFFPFVVRDIYGARVLPENLGNIELDPFYAVNPRLPADIVRAAERNLVVRDGFAAFYFHPFLPLHYLVETVEGIRALGYTFVSPTSL